MEDRIQERHVKALIYCANEAFRLAKAHHFVFFMPPYTDTQALMHLNFISFFYEGAVNIMGEDFVQKELALCFAYRGKDVKTFKRAYQRHLEEFPSKETKKAIIAAYEALDILTVAVQSHYRNHKKNPRK
jgi:hypothetical protein